MTGDIRYGVLKASCRDSLMPIFDESKHQPRIAMRLFKVTHIPLLECNLFVRGQQRIDFFVFRLIRVPEHELITKVWERGCQRGLGEIGVHLDHHEFPNECSIALADFPIHDQIFICCPFLKYCYFLLR